MKRHYFALALVAVFLVAGFGATSLYAADIKIAKIGFEGEMTGPLSMYGQPLAHGHQFAIDYINKVLFPKGMPIGKDLYHFELVVEDDGSNPSEAPLAAQRILDKGVFAMITVLGSWIEPVYPKLAEMKVPMITNSPFMTEKIGGWIYRYRNTPTQVMPAVARNMASNEPQASQRRLAWGVAVVSPPSPPLPPLFKGGKTFSPP